MTYDLAALHKKETTPHEHSSECEYDEDRPAVEQFLRCLRAELNLIRADI